MPNKDVVVLSAVRSAIGTFGGTLSQIEPAELFGGEFFQLFICQWWDIFWLCHLSGPSALHV